MGGAAVVGDKVYVVGGKGRNEDIMNSVFMYDPNMDVWSSSIPSMQSKRSNLGVAVLNDKIYAIGGQNYEEGSLNTAEVLDLTVRGTPEWRNIADMNDKRHSVPVAVLNGKIFAVGGIDGGHYLSSVES